jgi:hypothetical protein
MTSAKVNATAGGATQGGILMGAMQANHGITGRSGKQTSKARFNQKQ